MFSLEIWVLPFLIALGWFWLDSIRVRETAVHAARAACESEGLMLLDDSVAISRVTLSRDNAGRVKIQRAYLFEYSDTGDNRRKGSLVLLGQRVVLFNIGLRESAVVRTLH